MKSLITLYVCLAATVVNAADLTVKGKLDTRVAAIGGETTGVAVFSPDGTFTELLILDPELKALAERLDGKPVVASGETKIVTGIEIPERTVLVTRSLEPQLWGWYCTNRKSEFSVLLAKDETVASVYRGNELKTTLQCRNDEKGTGCWEKNLVDAGYTFRASREVMQTQPPQRHGQLGEVFIWGTRPVATLGCRLIP